MDGNSRDDERKRVAAMVSFLLYKPKEPQAQLKFYPVGSEKYSRLSPICRLPGFVAIMSAFIKTNSISLRVEKLVAGRPTESI